MDSDAVGWARLDKSGVAVHVPCKVWGIIVVTGSTTEQAVVYDGQDSGSGRLFSTLYCSAQGATLFQFTKPVHFDRGVYVDFVGNIDEVTVLWEPLD